MWGSSGAFDATATGEHFFPGAAGCSSVLFNTKRLATIRGTLFGPRAAANATATARGEHFGQRVVWPRPWEEMGIRVH